MALAEVYIGNPHTTSIKKRKVDNTYHNLDDFVEIIVFFTSGKNSLKSIKFSKTDMTSQGFHQLTRVNSETYLATLSIEDEEYLGCADIFISQDFRDSTWTVNNKTNKLSGTFIFTLVNLPVNQA